jgi:TDG/mug DNA glycosylase family protein
MVPASRPRVALVRQPVSRDPKNGQLARLDPSLSMRLTPPLEPGLPPIACEDAEVLILGSFPGGRSLAEQRYYAHRQNRFWPVMERLTGVPPTAPYDERTAALRAHRIALWDVLASCERPGSMDSAIVRASERPNDFSWFFETHRRVRGVCFNGRTAAALFARHVVPEEFWTSSDLSFLILPSTSPAHASMRTPELAARWEAAIRHLAGLTASA